MPQEKPIKRGIRSFTHRKKTTKAQQRFLDEHFSKYGLALSETFLDFSQVFGNSNPVYLEIGFGMGDSLLAEACENPQINYLGIEVYPAGVGKLLGASASANLQNLRLFKADAADVLDKCINNNCISQVKILFPDPWQKARHNKRRIIQPEFIEKIHRILRDNGILIVATDWEDYAEHIAEVLLNSKLKSKNPTGAYSQRCARPITKYESKAIKEGREVFNFEFYKPILTSFSKF